MQQKPSNMTQLIQRSILELKILECIINEESSQYAFFQSIRDRILSLNHSQNATLEEVMKMFTIEDGFDFRCFGFFEPCLDAGQNNSRKYTFFPTYITRRIFKCILQAKETSSPMILQGDVGSGKSTSFLVFFALVLDIISLKIELGVKAIDFIPINLRQLFNQIPKIIIIQLDKNPSNLVGCIKDQCPEIKYKLLSEKTLYQCCNVLVREYKNHGIKTYFVIDKGNEYFSLIRQQIKANQTLKCLKVRKVPDKMSQMTQILMACCQTSKNNTRQSTTFILSSNTLELSLLRKNPQYYNFMKQIIPDNVVSINYSSHITKESGQVELKLITIFEFERLLSDCLSRDTPQRQVIISKIKDVCRQEIFHKEFKFEFYSTFLTLREFVRRRKNQFQKILKKNEATNLKERIKKIVQEFKNELHYQKNNLIHYGLVRESESLKTFINKKSENNVERDIRVMIIVFFRKIAIQASSQDSGLRYFEVEVDKLVTYFLELTANDKYSSTDDIVQNLLSNHLYNNFIQRDGRLFRIFIKPKIYLKITDFIRSEALNVINSVDFHNKPIARRCALGVMFEETMLNIMRATDIQINFSYLHRTCKIKNRQENFFIHFYPKSSFALTIHFEEALKQLDHIKRGIYITCLPITTKRAFSQNSPNFDCSIIKKQTKSRYQIITFDYSISERIDSYISYIKGSQTKAEKASRILEKIRQNSISCIWKGENIKFSMQHCIICPQIIYQKIQHVLFNIRKNDQNIYSDIIFIPINAIQLLNLTDQLLLKQFQVYSQKNQAEAANILEQECILESNDEFQIKGERDTDQLNYIHAETEPQREIVAQKTAKKKKPCIKRKNKYEDKQYKNQSRKREYSRSRIKTRQCKDKSDN